MIGTRGLQSRAHSHNWLVGSFFGAQADSNHRHPHILHLAALGESEQPRESAEAGLWRFHPNPPTPPSPAQLAGWSPCANSPSMFPASPCAQKEKGQKLGAALIRLNHIEILVFDCFLIYKSSNFPDLSQWLRVPGTWHLCVQLCIYHPITQKTWLTRTPKPYLQSPVLEPQHFHSTIMY